jgi:hypothetical protein
MPDQVAGYLGCGGHDRVAEPPAAGCCQRTAQDAGGHRVAAFYRGGRSLATTLATGGYEPAGTRLTIVITPTTHSLVTVTLDQDQL